ncbi:ester cyclase [Microbulbifer sp. A4B17]|uniref:ester cyclase n=1 Tax=Microbulbifer sp. A4B17 TaxID=359370 RepID=UPI0013001F50|nr:ester cyclase [Microbulbifer sp. A4B17]
MANKHKEISKSLMELWGDNTPHKATDYLAPDYKNHQMPYVGGDTSVLSLQGWQELVSEFHKGFSDVKMELLLQVTEGDYVCTRWRITATHTGKFKQYKATGKTTSWTGVHTDRFKDGKMVESWVDWDKFTFMEKLGILN